jgi:hypothetical protein
MSVEIGAEDPEFLFWKYLFQIFGIVLFNYKACTVHTVDYSMYPVEQVM